VNQVSSSKQAQTTNFSSKTRKRNQKQLLLSI